MTGTLTINKNTTGLILNRDAVTNYNGIYYATATTNKWFIGMRENLSSNNHIHYSEQIAVDVLTLNVANGNATIYGNITIGNSAEVMGLIQMGASGRYGMGISAAYTNVHAHNSGNGVRLGYYDGTTFTARMTVPNGGAPTIDSSVILHAGNYSSYALPLSGGTMTGILTFNVSSVGAPNTSDQGTRIKLYDNPDNTQDYTIGIESQTMWFNTDYTYKWYRRNTQVMLLDLYGTLRTTGYLSTAGVTSNTIYWAGNTQSADFGAIFGQGTSSRSVAFKGNGSSTSVWWTGLDGSGTQIPFTAIDSTSGEFSFWRNNGGTGGGDWTRIMTMNASGLTINSGNFIGNLTGNISGNAATAYGWGNTPDSWYGIGQSTSAS